MQPQYQQQTVQQQYPVMMVQQQPIQLNPQPMPQQVMAVNMQGGVQYSQGASPMIQYAQPTTVMVVPQMVQAQPQPMQTHYSPPKKKGLLQEISDAVFGEPDDRNLPSYIYGRRYPTRFRCPKCNFIGKSRIDYSMGIHAWCMVLFFLVFFFPFVFLPCCVHSFKDIVHYCPRCNATVGRREEGCGRRHRSW